MRKTIRNLFKMWKKWETISQERRGQFSHHKKTLGSGDGIKKTELLSSPVWPQMYSYKTWPRSILRFASWDHERPSSCPGSVMLISKLSILIHAGKNPCLVPNHFQFPHRRCLYLSICDISSVSPELLQRFARALARVAFLRNMALLSINMKAIWRASFLKSREQADQCNNYGETEEVLKLQILAILRRVCNISIITGQKMSTLYKTNHSFKF